MNFDLGHFKRMMALENDVVFGTVNADGRYCKMVAKSVAKADKA